MRERARAYSSGEEAIFGVASSPSFEVLLDQVKEGKKEEKENKKVKVRLSLSRESRLGNYPKSFFVMRVLGKP